MKPRLINANALMDYCQNQMDRKIDCNDIAKFPTYPTNEWFDATKNIPVPKNLKINRYSVEAISSESDLVCYDYWNKEWNKIILEDDRVSYVPVEIREWTNKPKKE